MSNLNTLVSDEPLFDLEDALDEPTDTGTQGIRAVVPPIKCQGIKSKLVSFIAESIEWDQSDGGTWIEPFLGSGVVLFSIQPQRAIVSDKNHHIINFYRKIQSGELTGAVAGEYLEDAGRKLLESEGSYYYDVRQRFNEEGSSLDFLFLTRACFNGVMRFNKKGGFNVPFCKKPDRFAKAYITRIANQIDRVSQVMVGKDWEFVPADFRDTLKRVKPEDFIYVDPPYIGRHTGYIDDWTDEDATDLAELVQESSAGFALSMWRENKYRKNAHLDECWPGNESVDFDHFYHVGSTESLRNKMVETLIIRPGFKRQA